MFGGSTFTCWFHSSGQLLSLFVTFPVSASGRTLSSLRESHVVVLALACVHTQKPTFAYTHASCSVASFYAFVVIRKLCIIRLVLYTIFIINTCEYISDSHELNIISMQQHNSDIENHFA